MWFEKDLWLSKYNYNINLDCNHNWTHIWNELTAKLIIQKN